LARALADVTEKDHFGSDAFRTPGGIFATVWHATGTVNLKLTPEQQRRFLLVDGEGFVEIDNAWGRQGWTTANLEFVDDAQFEDALKAAWSNAQTKAATKRKSSGRETGRPSSRTSKKRS
jgi:hypothetical protein